MEEELLSAVPCSSLTVESVLRVATAGGLYGFCTGPRDARKIGLTGVSQASYVAKSIGRIGFQCGIVSGIFTMTHCGLQRYRGKNDWVNALVGGAAAGAAVAIGTRNWSHVVGTAGLVSVFSVLANSTRTDLKQQQSRTSPFMEARCMLGLERVRSYRTLWFTHKFSWLNQWMVDFL